MTDDYRNLDEEVRRLIGATEEELAQWVETVRLDVVWAARSVRYTGFASDDPGSVIRGIISVRAQGLRNDKQAHWLQLELDEHLADYKAEWQRVRVRRASDRGNLRGNPSRDDPCMRVHGPGRWPAPETG